MDNKINYSIPEEVVTKVTKNMQQIAADLAPYIIALSPNERQALPKMGDGTQPFVEKALAYTKTASQFAPPFMDAEGLDRDMKVHEQLTPLLRQARILCDGLDDTTMEAGAESYVSCLTYYNSVKMASKMDIPGAKSIYDDLRKRFEKVRSNEGSD